MSAKTQSKRGFTLVETVVTVALFSVLMASAFGLFLAFVEAQYEMAARVEASQSATMALARMTYGAIGTNIGVRAAGDVALATNTGGWVMDLQDSVGNAAGSFQYSVNRRDIRYTTPQGNQMVVADSVARADASVQSNSIQMLLRVNVDRGRFSVTQELNTAIRWRN